MRRWCFGTGRIVWAIPNGGPKEDTDPNRQQVLYLSIFAFILCFKDFLLVWFVHHLIIPTHWDCTYFLSLHLSIPASILIFRCDIPPSTHLFNHLFLYPPNALANHPFSNLFIDLVIILSIQLSLTLSVPLSTRCHVQVSRVHTSLSSPFPASKMSHISLPHVCKSIFFPIIYLPLLIFSIY